VFLRPFKETAEEAGRVVAVDIKWAGDTSGNTRVEED